MEAGYGVSRPQWLPAGASARRLFVAEVRAHPGRVAGAALACALTAAATGACVLLLVRAGSGDFPEGSVAAAQARDARDLLSLLLSLLLMCAVLVIGTTTSLWTGQRLGQFAVLRALGVTAGRLRRLVAGDVARLSVVAAAVGAVGTVPLAGLGHRLLRERALFPAGVPAPSAGQMWAVAAAVCAGTGAVAVLAALAGVLAAGRVRPATLLKDAGAAVASTRSRGRLVTGLAMVLGLCLPLLCVMAFLDLPVTIRAAVAPGLALMLIPTLAVLAPWLVPPLVRPVAAVLRVDRRVGRIAAAGLRAAPARTTAMAVPVLLAVGTAACLLGTGATMGEAVRAQTEQALRADAVVTAEPGHRLPAEPAALPGATVAAPVATEVVPPPTPYDDGPAPVAAWGADGRALARTVDLDERAGRMPALREGTFAAGATQADAHHWRTGQQVRLTLADGRHRTLTLAVIYRRDLAFPQFVLPRGTALAHTEAPHADKVLIRGAYQQWPRHAGQRVAARADHLDGLQPRAPADDLAARLIVSVVAGYTLLAAANSCALAQRDRRAQRAHLRAIGLGKGQLARCVLYECAGAVVVGAALAAATAVVCLVPFAAVLGAGVLPTLDLPWTLGILGAAVVAVTVPSVVTAHPFSAVREQLARRTT